jgi:hypothetical protein
MTQPKISLTRTDAGTPRFELDSGNEEYPGCTLTVATRGHRLEVRLPQIIRPFRSWVDTSQYAWSTNPRGGYWDVHPRRYGFYLFENHLYVSLGAQTDDSRTTQKWSCFLPWGEWRFVRLSLYGLAGEEFWTQRTNGKRRTGTEDDQRWDAAKRVPKVRFHLQDYDGEVIEATTHIEEREWKRGDKWCSWLSLFYRPMVRRSLDIEFSRETGPRKGSWKGGTMGTGIEMLPGELHEAAFRRYCAKNRMTLCERIETATA